MIYEYPTADERIRQGDIFFGIPRIEVSLQSIAVIDESGLPQKVDWDSIADKSEELAAVFPIRPVTGIVITQDCDAVRETDITLCEIRPLNQIYPPIANTEKTKGIVNILTQHARRELKWFYLPDDAEIGLNGRWAVDFSICLRVPRTHLELLRSRRKARLNTIADEHFREKLSEYFRRYPYDEWYPLNSSEYEYYKGKYPEAKPFPWQKENKS